MGLREKLDQAVVKAEQIVEDATGYRPDWKYSGPVSRVRMALHRARRNELVFGTMTVLGVKMIEYANPTKDRALSYWLHNLADQYDTRPTGQWPLDKGDT